MVDIIGKFADDYDMRYPGGKGRSFAHVINVLPPHDRYIESHLGGGAVLRNKLPAKANIGIEIDPAIAVKWASQESTSTPSFELVVGDALSVLPTLGLSQRDLVYMDPPYLPSTRKQKRVYAFDLTEDDHIELLSLAKTLQCMVVVSGYRSTLYDEMLAQWNRIDFTAASQSGIRTESLWFNYSPPTRLHDTRYLGHDYRQRQDVKRRAERLQARIARLQPVEKSMLLGWLQSNISSEQQNDATCTY
jgi:DNA adenine methylase